MQLALHIQEIDEHLVHVLVRVVPDLPQQAAEGVFYRAGHDGVTVRLDHRQVKNLATRIDRRNLNAFRKDLIELQQRALEAVHLPVNFGQRLKRQPVLLQHRLPSIVTASFARVGDNGLVLDRDQPAARITVREHLANDAVHLPRLR